jgi:hypothetical protein
MAPRERMHPYLDGLQYLINAPPLFVEYMWGLLVPTGLSKFHVFEPVYTLFEARSLISILVILLLAITVYGLRKRLGVIHVVAICLVVLPLLPVLYVPVLGRNIFAERYLYLPSAGYAILLVSVFKRLTGRSDAIKRVGAGIFLVLLGLHSFKAVKRTFDWRDENTLWVSAIAQDPENYVAYNELGTDYFLKDSYDNAIRNFEESIRLNTGKKHLDPLILGSSRIGLAGAFHKKGLLDEALRVYQEVMEMDPARYETHYNIALVLQEKGDLDRALVSYGNALRFAKEAADLRDIYNNVGNIYVRRGLYNEAIGYYEKALSIDPGFAVAANNLKLARRLLMAPDAR